MKVLRTQKKRGRRIVIIDWKNIAELTKYTLENYGNFTRYSNAKKALIAMTLIEKGTTQSLALEVLELKRTTFLYQIKKSKKEKLDQVAFKEIKKIFEKHRSQFGYRRIETELKKMGIRFNHKRIQRLMKKYNSRAKWVRNAFNKRVRKVGKLSPYPDLIKRRFKQIDKPLTVLYTDVTYLVHGKSKAYQSTIIDAATKEIIDYKISFANNNKLVMSNLRDAIAKIKKIKSPSGIIIHSDHGHQYTSYEFKEVCEADNLIISQSRAYTCADNIVIESFHSLLKKGTIHNNSYSNLNQYIEDLKDWNAWYNWYKNS